MVSAKKDGQARKGKREGGGGTGRQRHSEKAFAAEAETTKHQRCESRPGWTRVGDDERQSFPEREPGGQGKIRKGEKRHKSTKVQGQKDWEVSRCTAGDQQKFDQEEVVAAGRGPIV